MKLKILLLNIALVAAPASYASDHCSKMYDLAFQIHQTVTKAPNKQYILEHLPESVKRNEKASYMLDAAYAFEYDTKDWDMTNSINQVFVSSEFAHEQRSVCEKHEPPFNN